MLRESAELRDLLGGPLDPDQLDDARTLALGTLATGSTAVDVALDVARDHAVKAGDAARGGRRPRSRRLPRPSGASSTGSSAARADARLAALPRRRPGFGTRLRFALVDDAQTLEGEPRLEVLDRARVRR